MKLAHTVRTTCFALLAVFAIAPARGAIVNLTTDGSSGVINDAIYAQGSVGSGTGIFDTFLRVQKDGTESGYNTDNGTPLNDKGGHTFAITLGI